MFIEETEEPVVETTENTEETVEQTEEEVVEDTTEPIEEQEEKFTKSQVDEMINSKVDDLLKKKLARKEAKIRKEYEKKYSRLETVVNTGLGTNNIEESTEQLEKFYKEKGIDIPKIGLSEEQEERLALLDADELISCGYDDVVEEVDRLTDLGVENMSKAEKKYFLKLADYRQTVETEKELRANGISIEEMNTQEFKDIMNTINPDLSISKKIETYLKLKPKKETKQIGSLKNGTINQVKDYYSPEEISRLTEEELDDPKVWEAVRRSMTK